MKTQSYNLASFIQRTDALYKSLQRLIKRYPEDALQPDDKIFNRILTNDWRYLKNHFKGPVEKRYADANTWVEALRSYHSDLCDFCIYSLAAAKKLDELPMNPKLRLSASQCLDCLELQFQVLTRWENEAKASGSADHLGRLRTDLQALIQKRGIKTVAVEVRQPGHHPGLRLREDKSAGENYAETRSVCDAAEVAPIEDVAGTQFTAVVITATEWFPIFSSIRPDLPSFLHKIQSRLVRDCVAKFS